MIDSPKKISHSKKNLILKTSDSTQKSISEVKLKILFSILFLSAISVQISLGQFVSNLGKSEDKYINLSGRNYENYSSKIEKKKFFDNFGNFLIEGYTVIEFNESQKQAVDFALPGGQSNFLKSRYYENYFSNIVIGNDSYGGFNTRLMVGDAIRTKFTNLTLNKARFNGIRWDGSSAKHRGTLLVSRISDPIRFRFDQGFYADGVRRIRDWTQYLIGGHFETDIGDVLTVGLTYLNQHQRRASLDSEESSLKGVVSNAIPRVIFVRVSDDSPGDNSGPIVYQAPVILINGIVRPAVNIHGSVPRQGATTINDPIQYWTFTDFWINNKDFFAGADTTSFTRYINYRDRYSRVSPSYPTQISSVDGRNITYAYVIPEGATSVSFQMILANDYRIDIAHDWINRLDEYTGDARFISHSDPDIYATPVPFRTIRRADGNVKDASNKQIVSFSYGLATGMEVYGINFSFNWEGFEIEGEFNQSSEHFKYPIIRDQRFTKKSGEEFTKTGQAWYLRAKKKIGRLTLGGERYRIDGNYITALNIYTMENSFFSSPSDNLIPNPIFPDYLGYDGSTSGALIPGGAYFALVDDNDDNDRWEDGFYHYNVFTTDARQKNRDVRNRVGDFFLLGYRQNTNELVSLATILRRPDTGIFPGKDRDNDGIPDDDRNADGIPDFAQDFLTFYTDPPSLDYGDDWNNNDVIDEQENDILPDYPYNPDVDGYHVFSNLELLSSLNVGFGILRERGLLRGGFNNVDYFKLTYFTSTPRFGSLRIFYVLKRVRDNISNDSYQFPGVITTADPFPDYVLDPLNYKNSLVNSLYIGTTFTQIPNLRIENNIKIQFNKQFAQGQRLRAFLPESRLLDDQVDGRISFFGMVNKIEYEISFFNNALKVIPQFKIRTEKSAKFTENKEGQSITQITKHLQETIPIIRVDYKLTDNTTLHFGMQGITFLKGIEVTAYRIRNLKDDFETENRRTVAFSLSNKSQYAGYNIVIDFGYKFTTRDFKRFEDRVKGKEESTLYFSIFTGF